MEFLPQSLGFVNHWHRKVESDIYSGKAALDGILSNNMQTRPPHHSFCADGHALSRPAPRRSFLSRLQMMMARNRIGDLMVMSGILTQGELRYALARQKEKGGHLGAVLLREKMVTRQDLYRVLAGQWTLRMLAALTTFVIAFSTLSGKQARAASPMRDIPSQITLVSTANSAFAAPVRYAPLLGAQERRSTNLGAFTKWSGMFARFEQDAEKPGAAPIVQSWKRQIASFQGLPLERMAEQVNRFVNQQPYILDSDNWGTSDYWATPIEFLQRGGDCEDFAIAKYASLRALGVPEERLRIAIVHDKQKNIPHAVLIVYTDNDALVLDNQSPVVRRSVDVEHRYRPIFSINRSAWWLHSTQGSTMVASAAGGR